MYPNHYPMNYDYSYHEEENNPYEENNSYHSEYDERQLGGFPSSFPPFFPPMFPTPGQGPGIGPGPGGPGQGAGAPTTPPPSFVPTQAQTFAVDPGGIRRCMFRFTYVWLRRNQQFWFYPIFVGRNSIAGFRWTGFNWVYFGISLRQIESFTCV